MATPQASQGNGKGKAPVIDIKAPAPKSQELAIPKLKASALSKDVGPLCVKMAAQVHDDDAKAEQLKLGADKSRHLVLSNLTMAILKAAKADSSIDLTVSVGSGPSAQKAMGTLNDQICLALGLREVVEGKGGKQRLAWAKSVAQYFPQSGEDTKSEEYIRKNTFRGNFMNQVKKAEITALGLMENDVAVSLDKKAGTLAISGPAVKKQFGAPSVLLNEKQTVTDAKGKEQKLTEKPSFTAIASKTKVDHGAPPPSRTTNTRGAAAQSLANPGAALDGICTALVQALDRMKKPSAGQIASVKKVESAIDVWLSNNDNSPTA